MEKSKPLSSGVGMGVTKLMADGLITAIL